MFLFLYSSLFFKGKQITDEDTPLSVHMTNNARMIILVSSKGGKYIEPVMWFRTKKTSVEWDDSTDLSLTRWDALKF